MKYKELVLLEDLAANFAPEKNYRVYFTYDLMFKGTGTFRKPAANLKGDEQAVVASKELLKDFRAYLTAPEADKQGMVNLYVEMQNSEDAEELLADFLMINMSCFIEDEDTDVDSYLTGYEGPEIIYDFYTQDGYQGDIEMTGMDMDVLAIYDFHMLTEIEALMLYIASH